ncbi:DNA helicase PIF1, ATP-dependent [Tanacetum coccineum]
MHGLGDAENPSCPCTVDYKCTKKFPKQFNESTVFEDSGYRIYKRRNDGSTIKKSEIDLHNGYVVPYNPGLLRRYQAHINIEYCNHVGFIKYLFKYINKGPDRVSVTIDGEEVDEIKDYLNCRYLSACEAAWHIYGFDIHYRTPSVERGPMEWDDLKKVDNVLYPTYRDVCYTRGLLQGEKEQYVMAGGGVGKNMECYGCRRVKCLAHKAWYPSFNTYPFDPCSQFCHLLFIADLELSDIQRKNIFLTYIECMLRSNNMSLKDIPNMSYPDQEHMMDGYNRLIYDETSYNPNKLREQHATLYRSLTSEQKDIPLQDHVNCSTSKGEIVLNVASSGIATLLLEGGRTTHSRFAIPINVVEDSMCHIGADSDLADLILKAKLIIWDEAPMINMHCYEAFNRTLRDICRTDPSVASYKVFGGKVVLFGGDFRQILPVITNGGRQDVVNATISASYMWDKCTVLRLTVNMRLGSGSTQSGKKRNSRICGLDIRHR